MSNVSIEQEDFLKIINFLPEDLKEKLIKAATQGFDSKISILKKFIQEFEDDDMVDALVANVVGDIIQEFFNRFRVAAIFAHDKGISEIKGEEISKMLIESLCKVTRRLQDA